MPAPAHDRAQPSPRRHLQALRRLALEQLLRHRRLRRLFKPSHNRLAAQASRRSRGHSSASAEARCARALPGLASPHPGATRASSLLLRQGRGRLMRGLARTSRRTRRTRRSSRQRRPVPRRTRKRSHGPRHSPAQPKARHRHRVRTRPQDARALPLALEEIPGMEVQIDPNWRGR